MLFLTLMKSILPETKRLSSSFSMPGINFPPNRNIHLTLFSRFASQARQMVSYGSVWWTENIYSELHRPGLSSRIGDKPKFLGPFGYSYRLAVDFKKQGCFLCKKRTWTFTEGKYIKMDFMVNLLECHFNRFAQENNKVHEVRRPYWQLEQLDKNLDKFLQYYIDLFSPFQDNLMSCMTCGVIHPNVLDHFCAWVK